MFHSNHTPCVSCLLVLRLLQGSIPAMRLQIWYLPWLSAPLKSLEPRDACGAASNPPERSFGASRVCEERLLDSMPTHVLHLRTFDGREIGPTGGATLDLATQAFGCMLRPTMCPAMPFQVHSWAVQSYRDARRTISSLTVEDACLSQTGDHASVGAWTKGELLNEEFQLPGLMLNSSLRRV